MARTIIVKISTSHDDSDEALRSVNTAMKRAGYNYVDSWVWAPIGDTGADPVESVEAQCHAVLAVTEPEADTERVSGGDGPQIKRYRHSGLR